MGQRFPRSYAKSAFPKNFPNPSIQRVSLLTVRVKTYKNIKISSAIVKIALQHFRQKAMLEYPTQFSLE